MDRDESEEDTTDLLWRMRSGDRAAEGALYTLVYESLQEVARALFAQQGPGHTLQPTALVNEAFLRLTGKGPDWKSRQHFIEVAAKAMRHVLVDHERARRALKRGGDRKRIPLSDSLALVTESHLDVLALNEALEALEARDARKSRVVTLRFFGGLTMQEIAELLHVSRQTIEADWAFARSWLRAYMEVDGR